MSHPPEPPSERVDRIEASIRSAVSTFRETRALLSSIRSDVGALLQKLPKKRAPSTAGSPRPAEKQPVQPTERLELHFLDVGQGDATLVRVGDHAMLVDANRSTQTDVVAYLKEHRVARLDYVVATHPHDDHISALPAVLDAFPVGEVFAPEKTLQSDAASALTAAVAKAKVTHPALHATRRLGDATVTFVAPPSGDSNPNNWSLGVLVAFGKTKFLVAGDAERSAELAMVRENEDLRVDVLRVNHHGSKTSTTPELLDKTQPRHAVVSVGKHNAFRHPDAEVLDRLKERGVAVYRTDVQGTVVATSDGETVTWDKEPTDDMRPGEGRAEPAKEPVKEPVAEVKPEVTAEPSEEKEKEVKPEKPDPSQIIVHTTATGRKYHTAGCRYLRSDIEISLASAWRCGLEPCSVCGAYWVGK